MKMKKRILTIGIFLCLFQSTVAQNNSPEKLKPTVFEPGNISTEVIEYGASFSTSGSEIYFARSHDKWGQGAIKSAIYYAVRKGNKWSKPELVSFSGRYDDSDPHLTHDGNTLYFISKRLSADKQLSADIWMVKKDRKGKWGVPVRLNTPVNSPGNEYSPRTDKNGNLYFASNRPGGYGQGDLYMAKKEKGGFSAPVNLGNAVNTDKGEWNAGINEAGDLLIFEASGRVQNLSPYGDLYISFKINNKWTIAQHIKEINTTGSDLYPHLVNEHTLYFTSSDSLKSPRTNIYHIAFKPIYNKYKKTAVLPER